MNAKLVALCLLIGGAGWILPTELLSQTIDIEQAQADENFRLGVRAYHHGYLQEAVLYLEKALSLKPGNERPRHWLGRVLYRAGLEEAALKEWRSLLDSGGGGSLLRDTVRLVELRRGLGRELQEEVRYVVAQEVEGRSPWGVLFQRPTSVRPRPDGSVLIVSFARNEIVRADVNNTVLETWQGGLQGFDRPFDVLEDGPFVFVSEYGANRIARLTPRGQRQQVFGRTGTGPGQLLGPQYLATDGRGHLYVTDWGNRRVSKFDFEGRFLLSFGGRGGPGPHLAGPTGIAVSGEAVFVADRPRAGGDGGGEADGPGAGIEVYDLSGNHLRTLGRGFLRGPEGLVFEDDSTLLVADANRIVEYDLEREIWKVRSDLSASARRLASVGLSPNGEIYAADFDLSRLYILSEVSSLYSGMFVQVERVNSASFPTVQVSVSVQDRTGRPMVGLDGRNFRITEASQPVGAATLIQKMPPGLEVVVVVDSSAAMGPYHREVREAVAALYDGLAGRGTIRVVRAGRRPALEADHRSSRLELLEAAVRSSSAGEEGGRFDLAVRLAASQLIPLHARRGIVFLTARGPARGAFQDYSLGEITRYLANNSIAFHAVTFGLPPIAAELPFMAGETGAAVHSWHAPAGLKPLVGQLAGPGRPLYTLEYRSPSPARFGEAYVPIEIVVSLARRSGRDELGYYAPLSDR